MYVMMMTHDSCSGGETGTQHFYIYINAPSMCSAPAALLRKWITDSSRWASYTVVSGANMPPSGIVREQVNFILVFSHLYSIRTHTHTKQW